MFILNPKHKRRKHRRGHRRCACKRAGRKVIRFRGRRVGWKGLVRLKGVLGAKKIWRKAKKLLGMR